MKEDFLKNFKVGDQPLTPEIVAAILAENQRDIDTAKAPFADYDTVKEQLAEAQKTLKGLEEQDIEGARKAAKDWEEKYNQAVKDHEAKLADMAFDRAMESAITGAKGRSVKAILGELGADKVSELKASKNQEADIKTALEALKKDSGYLFDDGKAPPPYAAGTGGNGGQPAGDPTSLAGALRAKYNI